MLGWLKADHIQEPRSGVGIQPKVEPQGGTLGEKWGQSARADAAARNAKSVRGRCFWAQARYAPTPEWFRCALRDLGSTRARRLSLLFRQVAQDGQVEFLTLIGFDD